MKSKIIFLKAGFLWAVFCVDDLMDAFCISGTSMSFLVNLGECVYPIFLIVFPFLYSHRLNYHPQWCRSLVLSLTILMLALPLLFFLVKFLVEGRGCDFKDEFALLGMSYLGSTGALIYFSVCIVFVRRLLRNQRDTTDGVSLRLDLSSVVFISWCVSMPVLFDFSIQMEIIYWLSGLYYVSSLVSKKTVVDLAFSCTGFLVLPSIMLLSSLVKEGAAILKLFGFLFENSASRIPGIIVLTVYPALFFLVKFWQIGKIKTQDETLENNV